MLLRDLIFTAAGNEETALRFLREMNVLGSEKVVCSGKAGEKCLRIMREERIRERKKRWRCPSERFRTSRSVRASNAFFHYVDNNRAYEQSIGAARCTDARMVVAACTDATARSDSSNWCVFGNSDRLEPLCAHHVWQSDGHSAEVCENERCARESRRIPRMRRRKYGKGRLLAGDRVVSAETELQNDDSELPVWKETTPVSEGDVDSQVDFVRFGEYNLS